MSAYCADCGTRTVRDRAGALVIRHREGCPNARSQKVSEWRAFSARQLTGTPRVFHAYIGRAGPEETCCPAAHRSAAAAHRCAARAAARRNRAEANAARDAVLADAPAAAPDWTLPEGKAAERVLATVTELAARWHRHIAATDPFPEGMCAGWSQAIALLLGTGTTEVLRALESGEL